MTFRSLDVSIDERALRQEAQLLITEVLTLTSGAVARQTRGLERDLETLTKQAVKGNLWRAWTSDSYPRGGKPAYAPKGEVYVNGGSRTRGAMTYWTEEGLNRSSRGGYLAIPTEEAGANNRSRNMTPAEWKQEHPGVEVRMVYNENGFGARLVARNVLRGRNGVSLATSRRLEGTKYAGAQIVDTTIFILIPFQRFGNKFAIAPAHARRLRMLGEDVQKRLDRLSSAQ